MLIVASCNSGYIITIQITLTNLTAQETYNITVSGLSRAANRSQLRTPESVFFATTGATAIKRLYLFICMLNVGIKRPMCVRCLAFC